MAVAIIIVIEVMLNPYLSHHFFSHEVDRTLEYLNRSDMNQPVVTIGDSVGRGIFNGWKFDNGSVAQLACNQATETAGQYFFLKRFLEKNEAPGAIISCDRTPLLGNLSQNLTENYVQRCFTKWSEIFDLMKVKMDPVFTLKMIAYKFFPTFKYRLHLQRLISGFTNSDIYSGITPSDPASTSNYGLINLLEKLKERFQPKSISRYFFRKMAAELEEKNIPLYYLPPPARVDNKDNQKLIQNSIRNIEKLSHEFKNIHVIKNQYKVMASTYFGDEVHLNPKGLALYRPLAKPKIESIIIDSVYRQATKFIESFVAGKSIVTIHNFDSTHLIRPLQDVNLEIVNQKLIIHSLGNDPAVGFPAIPQLTGKLGDRVIVCVQLDSSEDTTAQLYYSFQSAPFGEPNSIKQRLRSGGNTLFFVLPAKFMGGNLRFDPGYRKGTYIIKKIETKVIHAKLLKFDSLRLATYISR